MGILCSFSDLKNAIVHDVNTLERYDDEVAEGHILSVLVFKNESEMESSVLADILTKASRKSDMLFFDKQSFVLLMPATAAEGAVHIFNEMHAVCQELKKVHVFVFPKDAFNDEEFYQKIQKGLISL